jgi:hypothetical protein
VRGRKSSDVAPALSVIRARGTAFAVAAFLAGAAAFFTSAAALLAGAAPFFAATFVEATVFVAAAADVLAGGITISSEKRSARQSVLMT